MRRPWWVACLLLGMSAAVSAGGAADTPADAEAGMSVDGTIVVGAQGKALEYTLKDPEALPEPVRRYLEYHIPRWEFEPPVVDGRPVALRNRMTLYLMAKPHEDGGMRIDLYSAVFLPTDTPAGYEVAVKRRRLPRYPDVSREVSVGATVFLILKVGRDGRVLDVVDEQVNLHFIPDGNQARRWRDLFARTSLAAVRKWTFDPPTLGEEAAKPYWSLRVPVRYSPWDEEVRYGQWEAYVPGPRRPIPWLNEEAQRQPLEGMASGTLYPAERQNGLKLLTQRDEG